MELVRWQQINNLLQAALELDPAERSSFIEQACSGDDSLRQEVSSLLSFDEQPLDLIDSPAIEVAACLLARIEPELTVGEYISHYRIVSLLGIGGMGEVYLAEDRKLERKIALKLLPAEFTKDPHRVRRFQQEARAASALNHPNIITIYETGKLKNRHFIATEFIEGETLRQRMRQTTLNLGEILDIAIQVANALTAAHQAGIVHRDIKPENIMLRPDGYAKVLDFGLAKLSEQSTTGSKLIAEESDTLPGLLMGTVKYMSPEQARGQNLDARSDIFSLGIVLYEMLANRLPFRGDTNSDVLASILKEEPTPLSELLADLPGEVEQIVKKALRKNPDERYQQINELLGALKEQKRELEVTGNLTRRKSAESGGGYLTSSIEISPHTQRLPGATTNPSLIRKTIESIKPYNGWTILTLLLVLLAGSWIGWRLLRKPAKPPFQEVRSSQLSDSDKALFADISPNGRFVAMVVWDGKPRLVLKDLETNNITTLVPPSDDEYRGNTFSVDGQSVYYTAWGQNDPTPTLYRVSLTGEDRQKVFDNVGGKISFSPDGRQFAFVRYTDDFEVSNLVIANMETKEERVIASRRSPDIFSSAGPSWSPDGKLIACATLDGKTSSMNVLAVNPGTGAGKFLSSDEWSGVFSIAWLPDSGSDVSSVGWLPDNSGLIIVAKRKGELPLLWHLSYPEGTCRRITNEPSHYFSNYTSLSLSADAKKLIASRLEQRTDVWVSEPGDANTLKQVTFGGNHWFRFVAWAPGNKIVFPSDLSGNRELWIMDADGTNQRQLTNSPGNKTLPVATPDGRYIVFTLSPEGKRKLWRMDIDGGNPIQLTNGEDDWGGSFTPDSQWLFYTSGPPGKTQTIWKVPIAGGNPIQFTNNNSSQPVVSPDGRQVACAWQTQNKQWKIAILPISGGEPTALLDPVPGDPIGPVRWAADGQAILYCKIRNQVANIWSHPINGGTPKQLTDFKSEIIERFDMSRDGRLLLSRGFTARDVVLIEDIGR